MADLSWDDEPPKTQIVKKPRQAELTKIEIRKANLAKQEELYRELEHRIMLDATAVTLGAIRFTDLEPASLKPPPGASPDWEPPIPQKWLDEGIPKDVARKMMRAACAALNKRADAPAGLHIAETILLGVLKIDASRNRPKAPMLNAQAVQVVVNNYPTKKIKGQ